MVDASALRRRLAAGRTGTSSALANLAVAALNDSVERFSAEVDASVDRTIEAIKAAVERATDQCRRSEASGAARLAELGRIEAYCRRVAGLGPR